MNIIFQLSPWCYFLPCHGEIGTAEDPYGRTDDEGRHHILQADGPEHAARVPIGFNLSYVYPPRLFVTALDDDLKDIPWTPLRKILKDLMGLWDYWDEVWSWRGVKGGKLTFYQALRSETQYGPNLSSVLHWLQDKPPEGDDLQWWTEGDKYVVWLPDEKLKQHR